VVSLGNQTLSLLLFVDDVMLIGRPLEELHILLNIKEAYLIKKELVLNNKKTE
jgi:hypothetical protein